MISVMRKMVKMGMEMKARMMMKPIRCPLDEN
jgi:hypothetical protein